MKNWLLGIGLLISPALATAGSILDYIRNYDLNDYAFGIATSVTQRPYSNAENSVIVYPYLTSLTHPTLTDDWLVLSGGEVGARAVRDSGWIFGGLGRIQTLGLGGDRPDELKGLNDRQWAFELAPFVGYRGWPVHLEARTFNEVSGRHGGWSSELKLELPFETPRGFLVSEVLVKHLNGDYTDYYFGVEPGEARPDRPEYVPGEAINLRLGLRWGWRLTPEWLLSSTVSYEMLDDAISASPIVNRNHTWSGSVGLAYNADIFQPRESNVRNARMPRLEIRVGMLRDSVDTRIVRDSEDGNDGSDIDLEDFLDISDAESVLLLDAIFRFGHFHRIELGYFDLGRDSSTVLDRDIQFGDEIFMDGDQVDVDTEISVARLSYAYSLLKDAQKELGFSAGLHISRLSTSITAPETGQREVAGKSTPLPVIGIHGNVALGRRSTLFARAQLFRLEFDNYQGSMTNINLMWQYRSGERTSIGVGYEYYEMKLDSDSSEINGLLQIQHQGPFVALGVNF